MIYKCSPELNNVQKGSFVEIKAMIAALANGFIVSIPVVKTAYDLLLEKDGKIYRTEVRSAYKRKSKNILYWISHVSREVVFVRNHVRKAYHYTIVDRVDLFLSYIPDEDIFFVIPASCLSKLKAITLNAKRSKYSEYKDAWHLIG